MNVDTKNTFSMDTQANELLVRLVKGEVEWLSQQDKFVLTENRKAIIEHLNTAFSKEISRLLEGEKCLDTTTLFWGLKLARFLEASETFQWTAKLCHLPIEDLDNSLGEDFVTEELSYLLADTIDQWSLLQNVIENSDINEFIRSACLDALIFSVVKKRIDREEIIDYFKSLFLRILNGELDDELLCTHLVSSCSDFWPGECLSEIRECFGLGLVDETHLGIDWVLERFSLDRNDCIEKLQKQIQQHSFWEALPKLSDLSDEEQSIRFDRLLERIDQVKEKVDQTLKEANKGSQRNEICGCGSGRKYKKCCMNQSSQTLSSHLVIEESMISYTPIEDSEAMKMLPEDVKESMLAFYPLLEENPEEILQKIPQYISKYPDVPMLYNFLYGAYRKTGHPREAMKLMKETVQLFPDYLFGRVEYALYLLRRGEPEKAHAALENASTLSQLYPERKIFHVAEWKAFSYAIGLYWTYKGDINQAKIFLAILQRIAPNSGPVKDLQKKIKSQLFTQSMEKMKEEV